MAGEIGRILRALGQRPWLIDAAKAEEIVAFLSLRAEGAAPGMPPAERPEARRDGQVAVLPLFGTLVPRADGLSEMSGAMTMRRFQAMFGEAAGRDDVRAIVIDVDSPGGMVDLVPETAAMIRGARREGRPIVAVANTMACSAAYWIATAADELVVTESGIVGSVGVYCVHEDISEALAAAGVRVSMIAEGPRKVEGNPFEPLGEEARAALQASVREAYEMFTAHVAKARGVPVSVVRADPERAEAHFGGGRGVRAREAVRLGMADRIGTLAGEIDRLSRPRGATGARRRRMSLA